jgi:hypothetical protein
MRCKKKVETVLTTLNPEAYLREVLSRIAEYPLRNCCHGTSPRSSMETHAEKHSNYARQDVLRWTLTLSGAAAQFHACLTQTPGIDTNELYRGTAWRAMYSSMDRSGPM